ncbi:MAG: hypothetical protein ACOYOI_07555 [Chthoniobacterales bacterium]
MKYLIPILFLVTGCATHKSLVKPENYPALAGTTLPAKTLLEVRNSEVLKAYPVGRYTDPNYPDAMHERHTLFRKEQSGDWNYRPNAPYALPMGPLVVSSNPSPSYYVKTDEELRNAQQKSYAEALQEENAAMKKRIESFQKDSDKVPILENQVKDLKEQLDALPSPSAPTRATNAPAASSDSFKEISETKPEAELITQMRINDECAAALETLEQTRRFAMQDARFLNNQLMSNP